MKVKTAREIAGRLSTPSKMPGMAWGIPARLCKVGSILREQAGSVCAFCYAMRGRYVQPKVQAAYQRRYDLWKASVDAGPQGVLEWVAAMAYMIGTYFNSRGDGANNMRDGRYFRVFDSGDLQGVEMLRTWAMVSERVPGVSFWLATREQKVVREFLQYYIQPANLLIRVSGSRVDGPAPKGFTHVSAVEPMNDEADWAEKVASSTPDKHYCPALLQSHECRDCRACWDPKVRLVVYAKT